MRLKCRSYFGKSLNDLFYFLWSLGFAAHRSDCTAFCKVIDEPFHTICCLVMRRERFYQTTKMVYGGGEVPKPESTEGRPWGQSLKKPEGAPLNLG